MFSRSKVNIIGGVFTQIGGTGTGGFEVLKNAAAPSAFHDSADRRDPPKCHPNTRVAVLEKIMAWILGRDPETRNALIKWLCGPAGSGKSAIAQTIAERCAEEGILLASFFFFRSDPTRNHSRSLIATIAYQIATRLHSFRQLVAATIENDPHIFNRSLSTQVASLIVEPLQDLISQGFVNELKSPRLIIIDGLDECDRGGQLDILHAISDTFQKHHIPLIFLIVSRPEYEITNTFCAVYLEGITSRLALDNDYGASADITLFLRDQFTSIKENHPLKTQIPHDWPAEEVLDQLTWKSSGQFIYAATVMKFVKSIRHRPHNRLEIVLGLHPATSASDMPFAELDALYQHVFLSVQDLDTVLLILSWHMLMRNVSWSVGQTEEIFSLSPGETRLLLCDLPSVVDITEENGRDILHFFHASLADFLFDKSRSKDLHIDVPQRSAKFSCRLLQYFPRIPVMNIHLGPVFDALAVFMKLACLTAELRQEIMDFNITKYFHSSFGHEVFWYMPEFIRCITISNFIDAHDMIAYHTQLFEKHAISQLDIYYADPRLLSLVSIIGSGIGWLPDGLSSTWMVGDGIGHLFCIDHRLRNIDQNGLGCLPRESDTFGIVPNSYFKFLVSFLSDKGRSGIYALDGDKYAMAALYVLRYTSDHSQRKHRLVAKYANRDTPTFKNSPRKWYRKSLWMNVAFRRREKLQNQFHSLQARQRFYFKLPEASKFNNDWLWRLQHDPYGRAFEFGLECLPELLSMAGRSEELINFTGRHSFGPISTAYQREIKVANKAIARYVKRMESHTV